jgi:alpha-glucan phosphorylase-like protein
MRIKQELLLGIGGTQMLEDLKYQIDIFHSNEGHSAFNGLERLRKLVRNGNMPIQVAYETVRSSSLFTTHTPVPAGHDRFEESLMRTYLNYMSEEIGINWYDFMGLGREDAHNQAEDFNMSHLATHLSQEVNGVSKLHGEVTRDMFKTMFPGFDKNELNIGHVTNGVHYGTWTAFKFQELYEKTFGKTFLKNQADATNWEKIYSVPDEKIWEIRQELKVALIERLKQRLQKSMSEGHINPNKAFKMINTLNPNELIFGFARRFATYKRGSLLFTNVDRLLKIVNNSKRPVLFIFAGKAHPNDKAGQDLIKRKGAMARLPSCTISFRPDKSIRGQSPIKWQ